MGRMLLWIIKLPSLLFDILLAGRSITKSKEYAKKPIACPNCGKSFYAKWHQLWILKDISLIMTEKVKMKCPHCKQTDLCRWQSDQKDM